MCVCVCMCVCMCINVCMYGQRELEPLLVAQARALTCASAPGLQLNGLGNSPTTRGADSSSLMSRTLKSMGGDFDVVKMFIMDRDVGPVRNQFRSSISGIRQQNASA